MVLGRCAQFLMDGDNCGGTWVKEHRVQAVKSFHFGSLKDIGILKRRTHISSLTMSAISDKKIVGTRLVTGFWLALKSYH